MKARISITLGTAALLLAGVASAQDAADAVIFGAYYECNQATESRADELFESTIAGVYDKHLAAGHLLSYGWLSHQIGDRYRRLGYMVAPDMNTMLDTRDAIIEDLQTNHAEAAGEFNSICTSHDDYIWSRVASSNPDMTAERPEIGISQYYYCNVAKETDADAIVQEAFAPILNRHVEAGNINSWAFHSHVMGGPFRRLFVIDGADAKSVMAAWGQINQDLQAEVGDAATEFSEICGTHHDYMWNIDVSKP
jgi:hypothetical protein